MGDGDLDAVDNNAIPRKKGTIDSVARLDNRFTIAQYAIVDRLDGNHDHSTALSLFDLRS
jgi:hypothetical protein